ncbi:MAG: phosphoribosylamine--glycine ligase, partial [Gammaproteobacteria bacterium]|nr:phosphoribosylamine--glycine ligase [Gammaproteobacteria bacterium]
MKVLIIGSGGREYALARKISESKLVEELYTAPGNGGTSDFGVNIPIKATDINGIAEFAKEMEVGLVVVGPEDPLAMGITSACKKIPVFGTNKDAAQMESSKLHSKSVMEYANVPMATPWKYFEGPIKAMAYLVINWGKPHEYVVKADGLAQGKGVLVPHDLEEALVAIDEMMVRKKYKSAGNIVVLERKMGGEEGSAIGITDSKTVLLLASSQDHKPVGDGDTGPNTGGMGAYSPAPVLEG